MKDYTDIIYSPVITEKSAYAAEKGVYTFKVAGSANKVEIKKAIEKAFDVKVEKVNTLNTKSKNLKCFFVFVFHLVTPLLKYQ